MEVTAVYGGAPIGPQERKIEQGSDMIVGTPGRLNAFIRDGVLVSQNREGSVLNCPTSCLVCKIILVIVTKMLLDFIDYIN